MTEESSLHTGHRQRMREKLLSYGSDVMQSHELLEMLLFHSLRQGDTNPVAHRILESHPNVALGITDSYELTDVEGVGKNTANLLRVSTDTVLATLTESLKRAPMESEFTRKQFLWLWSRTRPDKRVAILLLDEKDRFVECRPLNISESRLPRGYARAIICALERTKATKVVLCHNHKTNVKTPSVEDIYLTGYLKKAITEKGYSLIAHYIITDTDCVDCPFD